MNREASGFVYSAVRVQCEQALSGRPYGLKFYQLHAVFLENLEKSYIGVPQKVGTPPMGNPGSARGGGKKISLIVGIVHVAQYVKVIDT